eukprot:gnl/Dysnectes_brevis/7651_a13035_332.p1 GENE.gnl/Dysnectes_brevis/7651_a13035_332~~gnl/Dysnectes_brevis/7651_a13035_332.p1  ORF type:complete len:446 (-),score=54.13 gnl/Dysnectes_brevis/7651_a13035_332:247-1584(-)
MTSRQLYTHHTHLQRKLNVIRFTTIVSDQSQVGYSSRRDSRTRSRSHASPVKSKSGQSSRSEYGLGAGVEIASHFKRFSRKGLCDLLGITYRDLRNLFVEVSIVEPRDNCLIVSFGQVNCCITPDCLYLIFPGGEVEDFAKLFPTHFQTVHALEAGSALADSWELIALEVIVFDVVSNLQTEYKDIQREIENSNVGTAIMDTELGNKDTIDDRPADPDSHSFPRAQRSDGTQIQSSRSHHTDGDQPSSQSGAIRKSRSTPANISGLQLVLAQSQQRLTALEADLQRAARTLDDLLEAEDDIARLSFLNQRMLNRTGDRDLPRDGLPISPSSIADLLETYLFQVRAIQTESKELQNLIENKLEVAELILDDKRNRLIYLELRLSSIALGVDVAAMLATAGGMNLYIPAYDIVWVFWAIFVAICAIGMFVALICLHLQHKVDKKEGR